MARKKVAVKKKVGRKLKYDPAEVLPRVEKLAAAGLNNKEICKSIKIDQSTFYDWLIKFPELSHSLSKYRGLADIQVENALFKSSVGFECEETKLVREKDKATGEYKMVVSEVNKKHIAPNANSIKFYLKNRMPDRYRDKVETEISIPDAMEAITFSLKRREAD